MRTIGSMWVVSLRATHSWIGASTACPFGLQFLRRHVLRRRGLTWQEQAPGLADLVPATRLASATWTPWQAVRLAAVWIGGATMTPWLADLLPAARVARATWTAWQAEHLAAARTIGATRSPWMADHLSAAWAGGSTSMCRCRATTVTVGLITRHRALI